MIDNHFNERLTLRDKFTLLAREVLVLNHKKPYSYFELKRRMREKHDIYVTDRIKRVVIKPRKRHQMSDKKHGRVWMSGFYLPFKNKKIPTNE